METTDVIICGCGPTGAMLSVLLGQHSVRNVVLEQDRTINTDPRGIALDEDGIRCLQACGIYDKIFTDIGQCMGRIRFIGGVHNDLNREPFLAMNYNTTEGGTGHPGFMCHKQPCIEKNLRERISSSKTCELRTGASVTSIYEDDQWVYAIYLTAEGQEKTLRARFLVGADGKTGFTRKRYLEPRGIKMEQISRTLYEEVWVALNWKMTLPTQASHPDFPLWQKGYTPSQVYDIFFPPEFRFLCNYKRSAVCSRFGLNQDRLWRFEFVVLPGEDGQVMAGPEMIQRIVFPYITLPGARFGLAVKNIQYPEDCIEVLRSRPFTFSARSCNKWAQNRVIICGDAAHVFPPFGGQGIASGFRDAISLAWRLALSTRQTSETAVQPNFERLLDGWYLERKQQLDKSLASTIENGNYVREKNPLRTFIRDLYFWAVQLVPSWKHDLELGNRREGMVKYQWQPGGTVAFLPSLGGGGNFPQVYCVDVSDIAEKVNFTDDIIFAPSKIALFQIVAFIDCLPDFYSAQETLSSLDTISKKFLRASEATYILRNTETNIKTNLKEKEAIYRLATGTEFAADDTLCCGRPEPQYYDPYRISTEVQGKRYVILRPDRFVYAACNHRSELITAAKSIAFLSSTLDPGPL